MCRELRQYITDNVYEFRAELLPDRRLPCDDNGRALVIGVLAAARRHAQVDVHALAVSSGGYRLLGSPASARDMARFLEFANRELSARIGREFGWVGPKWRAPTDWSQISNEAAVQAERLADVLDDTSDDGFTCAADWAENDGVMTGAWVDWTRVGAESRRTGETVAQVLARCTNEVELRLEPLPSCRGNGGDGREEMARMAKLALAPKVVALAPGDLQIAASASDSQPNALVAGDHGGPPARMPRRPSLPRVRAAAKAVVQAMLDAADAFVAAFREAVAELRETLGPVHFPLHCFPPRYVQAT